jgi:thiamine-phosphate pyrophosphorylase
MLLYYITDRMQLSSHASDLRSALLEKVKDAADHEVDYIQLREKDLPTRELERLASDAVRIVRESNARPTRRSSTRLLINSRVDVALSTSADGVHLRSDDISSADARSIASAAGSTSFSIARSCHTLNDVRDAQQNNADFIVFGPIFEKNAGPLSAPIGLTALAEAARSRIPVLALGGITLQNAYDCVRAGAAGIAAIRLFQGNPISEVVSRLRH